MKILNNKKYKFHCYECSSDILFSKEDCLVDRTYGDFWLNCPVCRREYDNQTYKIFRYEYIEEYNNKDKEIERLNNIINGMEKFFQYAYDNEVRPLNDRKVSVWTICLDKLQELKGSSNNG